MSTISSLGIGSGLNSESIISALMSTERRPLQLMQTEASSLQSKISIWGNIQSQVASFQDAARALSSVTIWNKVKASVSNATAMTVAADSSATPGNYAVQVSRLASGQSIASTAVDGGTTFGAGTLKLQLGSWTTGSFVAKSGAVEKTVTVEDGDTLEKIRDKINAAGAGISASIITDASGARLVMRSNETGETNGFRVTAEETDDDGAPETGLSKFDYSTLNGSSLMQLAQPAQNSLVKVDGISISSATNTVSTAIQGVTLQLKEEMTTAAELSVATDTAEVATAIDTFISTFNTLMGNLKNQTKYDAATKKGGPLQGDSAAVGMITQMRNMLNESFTGGGSFSRLSDVGIEMNKDGTLKKTTSDVEAALTKLGDLKMLFSADGTGSMASTGFMQRYEDWARGVLGLEGTLESRKGGLESRLDRNKDRQDAMSTRLEQTEKRLRAQYEALDTMMAKLNGTSSYVTQMINTLG